MVENALIHADAAEVARRYIKYRYQHEAMRKGNSFDGAILSLVNYENEDVKQENSNKNPEIIPTQRDYIAGEVSKNITRRLMLPADIMEAHDNGIIHFHDADYFIQHSHNCFAGDTTFATPDGDRRFDEFNDLDLVDIFDRDGVERTAVIRTYGLRYMQTVTFRCATLVKKVVCTPDHRWYLADGSVTTALKVGDMLGYGAPWVVESIKPEVKRRKAYCVSEPVTHSFFL